MTQAIGADLDGLVSGQEASHDLTSKIYKAESRRGHLISPLEWSKKLRLRSKQLRESEGGLVSVMSIYSNETPAKQVMIGARARQLPPKVETAWTFTVRTVHTNESIWYPFWPLDWVIVS